LNPGPPPYQYRSNHDSTQNISEIRGEKLTTRIIAPAKPVIDNTFLEAFKNWLSGQVSDDTRNYYVNVINNGEWPPSKNKRVKAWRKYVQFLFSAGRIDWQTMQQYLAFLRLRGNKRETQTAIPVTLILKYKDILTENGLGDLYTLLLSGARLKHILRMLEKWSPAEQVRHPTGRFEARLGCGKNYWRYYLGIREGNKRADYIYFPRSENSYKIPRMNYKQLKDKLRRLGVKAKLFRKFVNQTLEELAYDNNIRLDAVNLIMSRELSVTGTSYVNVRDWSDKLFSKYVEFLREQRLL